MFFSLFLLIKLRLTPTPRFPLLSISVSRLAELRLFKLAESGSSFLHLRFMRNIMVTRIMVKPTRTTRNEPIMAAIRSSLFELSVLTEDTSFRLPVFMCLSRLLTKFESVDVVMAAKALATLEKLSILFIV